MITSINYSDIDQYIKKNEGIPQEEKHLNPKRVQHQLVRFDYRASLPVYTPISMLIPIAVRPNRHDDFMSLDDCPVSFDASEPYDQYKESFSECLRKYMIYKNLDDAFVYKNANLSQPHWITIINSRDYEPGKRAAIAIVLAMQLKIEEAIDLLKTAGHELSHSQVFDLIIEYSITNEIYDIFEINEFLSEFHQPLLG